MVEMYLQHMKLKPSNLFVSKVLIALTMLLLSHAAYCIPLLQLDVGGGTYVGGKDETVYANSTTFSLYALYSGSVAPSGKFYLSVAIQPKQEQALIQPNFGTFTINGNPYSSGLNYGIPPLAVVDDAPKVQDLGKHEIYPTYYAEIEFEFNLANQAAAYNSAQTPGGLNTSGTGLYYQLFTINVSGLLSTYSLHFDLYNEVVKNVGTGKLPVTAITLGSFAPFSHDAQSTQGGTSGNSPVPDGGSALLLGGIAFLALVWLQRRFAHA
jgi:hypothetical protein